MKLTLTKRDHALILAALYLAMEYESTLADAWDNADPKIAAKSRRRVKSFRRVRSLISR